MRSRSLELLTDYTDASIRLAEPCPGAAAAEKPLRTASGCSASCGPSRAGRSPTAPTASAPRLYVETLNEMIDQQTVRKAALNNRVPPAVLWFELASAMLALGLLAFYLALLDRAVWTVLLAAALVSFLLLVTFDLDRPRRGPDHRSRHAADGSARVDGPATRRLAALAGAPRRCGASHPKRVVRPL